MKDLEEASWMKIERSDMTLGVRTLSISQEQYVETILEWHGMTNSNPVKIPMIANLQLPSLTEAEIDITEYQRCIGSLMYLMVCTRPDIAYAVGVLSRHVTCPGNVHMQAVKRVFRYLRGTSHFKLNFQVDDSITSSTEVYVDSDWAGDRTDRKSISGYVGLIDGGAVSWGSRKQTSVSLSTVEAEFIAVSTAVKEILWHRSLFSSLNVTLTSPTSLLIDNQGALDLIKSGQINDRTKHIDIKFRHVYDQEDQGRISSQHVATQEQIADIMTKPLGAEKFSYFREMIGVHA